MSNRSLIFTFALYSGAHRHFMAPEASDPVVSINRNRWSEELGILLLQNNAVIERNQSNITLTQHYLKMYSRSLFIFFSNVECLVCLWKLTSWSLKRIRNILTTTITKFPKFEHISPIQKPLFWLPMDSEKLSTLEWS